MSSAAILENKRCVLDLWGKLDAPDATQVPAILRGSLHPDISWSCVHPINILQGADAVIDKVWMPLITSFPDITRRVDILLGGQQEGRKWVTGAGYLIGTFVRDWLGIPATGKTTHIRFTEFYDVREGKIAEAYVFFDILDVMRQVGIALPQNYGGRLGLIPGPTTGDGVILPETDPAESAITLKLVEAMIDGLMQYDGKTLQSMQQSRYWKQDMHWYGPTPIGTCLTLKEFEDFHQRPYLIAFPDRKGGHKHIAHYADGLYATTTGWPSVEATHLGEYFGIAPTGKRVAMRVMDIWRREGNLLAENWVMIDMLDLFLQMGLDLMANISE